MTNTLLFFPFGKSAVPILLQLEVHEDLSIFSQLYNHEADTQVPFFRNCAINLMRYIIIEYASNSTSVL